MKKAVSFTLMALLALSMTLPVAAQRTVQRGRNQSDLKTTLTERNSVTSFATVEAYTDGRGVWLEWQMAAENDNIGFLIYRIAAKGFERIFPEEIVEGSAMRLGRGVYYGTRYNFFDAGADPNSAYFVEAIQLDGGKIASPAVTPHVITDLAARSAMSARDLENYGKLTKYDIQKSSFKLPGELAREAAASLAAANDSTHREVIARPGVRIAVREEGLYRVTRAQLEAGGFNVSADPSLWQLHLAGVEQAINVGPNGDWIEFYGRALDIIESDTRIYFLTVGSSPGKRMAPRGFRPSQGTVVSQNYAQTFIKKERLNYIDQIINGEAENYWGRAVHSTPTTVSFDLSGIDTANPQATFNIKLQGFSNGQHVVEMILNGSTLQSPTGAGKTPYTLTLSIPTNILVEGTNSLQLKAIGPTGDFSLFDSLSLGFARKYKAEQNKLFFYTSNYRQAKVDGFTSADVRLFDTTNPDSPVPIANLPVKSVGSTFGFDIPAARGRVFYAVEDTAVRQPVGITPNKPEMLGLTTHEADLVIISHENFLTEANAWAQYRRSQGVAVKVVDTTEIFDEFNFGTHGYVGIKRFLQYASENWRLAPRYVLLFGDATWDPRNYEGRGYHDYVPTRVVSNIFSEAASDEALADFNNDGLSELAIGRIPIRNSADAMVMLNKTISWETALVDPLSRGALFAYDLPIGYDFESMSNRIANKLPADMSKVHVSRAETDPNPKIISAINSGKYIVNYTGHGASGTWAANAFFSSPHVSQLTNAEKPSIFTMLTCLNGYFYSTQLDSLAETLVKAPNGGAVVAWASTGLTTPDIQEIMAARFFEKLGVGAIPRMGDLIKDAKTVLGGGSDVRLSWALMGDPMLKVR